MKIFFVFLCFAFLAIHAVHGASIGVSTLLTIFGGGIGLSNLGTRLHQSQCCNIFNYRCCCIMNHGGTGKFHSWSSDFYNGGCVDKGGCDMGWKC